MLSYKYAISTFLRLPCLRTCTVSFLVISWIFLPIGIFRLEVFWLIHPYQERLLTHVSTCYRILPCLMPMPRVLKRVPTNACLLIYTPPLALYFGPFFILDPKISSTPFLSFWCYLFLSFATFLSFVIL